MRLQIILDLFYISKGIIIKLTVSLRCFQDLAFHINHFYHDPHFIVFKIQDSSVGYMLSSQPRVNLIQLDARVVALFFFFISTQFKQHYQFEVFPYFRPQDRTNYSTPLPSTVFGINFIYNCEHIPCNRYREYVDILCTEILMKFSIYSLI